TFGWERILGATAVVSGEVLPDGTVRFTLNERLALGELPAGTSERAEALAATLVRAGLRAEVSPHIQTEGWSKYVSIARGSAGATMWGRHGGAGTGPEEFPLTRPGTGPSPRSGGDAGLCRAQGACTRRPTADGRHLLPAAGRGQPAPAVQGAGAT